MRVLAIMGNPGIVTIIFFELNSCRATANDSSSDKISSLRISTKKNAFHVTSENRWEVGALSSFNLLAHALFRYRTILN